MARLDRRWPGTASSPPRRQWSGDGRCSPPDALRFRDLPLPLTWQKATERGPRRVGGGRPDRRHRTGRRA